MLKSRYFMKINWNIFQEKRCLFCGRPFFPKTQANSIENYIYTNLCEECAGHIKQKTSGFCRHCGELLPDEKQILPHCGYCTDSLALWEDFLFFTKYDGIFRELILQAKFNHNRASTKFLGELLALHFTEHNENLPNPLQQLDLIPMPLHDKRLVRRGHNQCLEILKFFTRYLAEKTKYTVSIHTDILQKKVHTVPQSSLDKKERQKNIKNSFTIQNHALKEIILWL
jgi:predicted amidophosphoribosyltransferase